MLWHHVFKNNTYYNSHNLVIYSLFVVTIVFIFCSFIDFIKQKNLDRLLIDKIINNDLFDKFDIVKQKIVLLLINFNIITEDEI